MLRAIKKFLGFGHKPRRSASAERAVKHGEIIAKVGPTTRVTSHAVPVRETLHLDKGGKVHRGGARPRH